MHGLRLHLMSIYSVSNSDMLRTEKMLFVTLRAHGAHYTLQAYSFKVLLVRSAFPVYETLNKHTKKVIEKVLRCTDTVVFTMDGQTAVCSFYEKDHACVAIYLLS